MGGDGGAEVQELVENHPVFQGRALCNVSFVLAMNKGIYDGLPDDLNAVIDRNSGIAFVILAFLPPCQIAGGHAAVEIFYREAATPRQPRFGRGDRGGGGAEPVWR